MLICFGFALCTCGPDPIPDPVAVQLVAPKNLDRCITADKLNDTESQVNFVWNAALYTDDYELVIRNQKTGIVKRKTTVLTSLNQVLQRGANYSWWVVSRGALTAITTKSEVWHFYVEAEPELKHTPFPAALLFPDYEETVSPANNQVQLEWKGSDLDNDIAFYQLFFGTNVDNLVLVEDNLTQTEHLENVASNTTYYWKVVTVDREGNTSESRLGQFSTE